MRIWLIAGKMALEIDKRIFGNIYDQHIAVCIVQPQKHQNCHHK